MIKVFLYNTKDTQKTAYIWNTWAAMLNSFQSVLILMVISRIDPVTDAGVFTIAFAIGNLMLTIGQYGIRCRKNIASESMWGSESLPAA